MEELITLSWLFFLVIFSAVLGDRKPGIVAGLGLSVYVVGQFSISGSVFLASNPVLPKALVAIAIFGSVVRQVFKSGRLPFYSKELPIYIAAVLLYGYAALSTLWSRDPAESQQVYLSNIPYILSLTLCVPLLVKNKFELNQAFNSFLVISGITLTYLLFFREWGMRGLVLPIARGAGDDWMALESTPLDIGTAAGMVFIICVMRNKNLNLFKRSVMFSLALVMLALMFRAGVRGQIIAVAISWIVCSILSGRGRSLLFYLSIFIMMSLLLAPIFMNVFSQGGDDILLRFSSDELARGTDDRLVMQLELLGAYVAGDLLTLFFGLGSSSSYSYFGIYPHNIFIEVLCELGLVGFLALMFIFLRTAYVFLRRGKRVVDADQYFPSLAILIYLLIISSKQWNLLGATTLLAVLLILNRISFQKSYNRAVL